MNSGPDFAQMLSVALEEARKGLAEGGIPVGAAIFNASGELVGAGHNRRVQNGVILLCMVRPTRISQRRPPAQLSRFDHGHDARAVLVLQRPAPAIWFWYAGSRGEPEFSGWPRLAALARRACR